MGAITGLLSLASALSLPVKTGWIAWLVWAVVEIARPGRDRARRPVRRRARRGPMVARHETPATRLSAAPGVNPAARDFFNVLDREQEASAELGSS